MKYQQATGELANLPINIREEKHIHEIRAVIWKTVKEHPEKTLVCHRSLGAYQNG